MRQTGTLGVLAAVLLGAVGMQTTTSNEGRGTKASPELAAKRKARKLGPEKIQEIVVAKAQDKRVRKALRRLRGS